MDAQPAVQLPDTALHPAPADGLEDLLPPQRQSAHGERLDFEFAGRVGVSLEIDAMPGCGGLAWPAGEVLSEYLATYHPDLSRRMALELGAGTALVGLVAARLGAKVIVTDQRPLLETMRRNIVLNDLSASVSVAELNWGDPYDHVVESAPIDLILAADCVYFEPAFPLLVETLDSLASRYPGVEILFCYKRRRKADKRFFSLLKKKFTWVDVEDSKREIYNRESISLLQLKWKSSIHA